MMPQLTFNIRSFSCCVAIITVACIGVYYNSLSVPFYLDDVSSITNNPAFSEDATYSSLFAIYGVRIIGYVTLWWDYLASGLDHERYHIVNVVIHSFASIAVFILAILLQVAAARKINQNPQPSRVLLAALVIGLVFAVHPLQTQAVTYIIQRLASLTALFYLLAITTYLSARIANTTWRRWLMVLLAIGFSVLSMLTKQNAVTLPLAIVLIELLFFSQLRIKHLIGIISVLFIMSIACYLFMPEPVTSVLVTIDKLTRENLEMTRWQYFSAQLSILWVYIGKFFYPYPLNLEYSYTVDSFSNAHKLISAAAHLAMLGFAIAFAKRAPMVCFGILFYYLAHSVESGIIPITDLAFEHRNYLPNLGLILALVCGVGALVAKGSRYSKVSLLSASVFVLAVLSTLTIQRNQQWQDPEVFYAHELKYNPEHPRILHSMAEIYLKKKDYVTAMMFMNRLYETNNGVIDGVMVNTHLSVLINQRQYGDALALGEKLLEKPLHPSARSVILSNMGIIYVNLQQHAKARPYFDEAVQLGQLPINSLIAYGYTLYVLNDLETAKKVILSVLQVMPQEAKAQQLMQMIDNKAAGN